VTAMNTSALTFKRLAVCERPAAPGHGCEAGPSVPEADHRCYSGSEAIGARSQHSSTPYIAADDEC
jgi:hypothetical protein